MNKEQIAAQVDLARRRLGRAAMAQRSIVAATRSLEKWEKKLEAVERAEKAARENLYRQADLALGRLAAEKLQYLPAVAAEWAEVLTRTAPEDVLQVLQAQGWFPLPKESR